MADLIGSCEPGTGARKRILEEAEAVIASKPGKRRMQPWSFNRPLPGMAAFDSNNDLEEVPIAHFKRRDPPSWDSASEHEYSGDFSQEPLSDLCDLDDDPLMQELDQLYANVRSKDDVYAPSDYRTVAVETERTRPRTRPITQEQLVNEVKGIYAGLVMVEKKCVEISQEQAATTNKLSNEQWQALNALHRTLLHEHRDFYLAAEHPSAPSDLRRLVLEHNLPGRLWRHGRQSMLELLRRRLPDHLDTMIDYTRLSHEMLADLDQKYPQYGSRWAECMEDLQGYQYLLANLFAKRPMTNGGDPFLSGHSMHLLFLYHGQHSHPSRIFDGITPSVLDEWNEEEPLPDDLDRWFGALDPSKLCIEEKHKSVLLGWLHYGRTIARSFWSYRTIFKTLLINILL